MTDQEKLQVLLDRAEISEVVYNYATGVEFQGRAALSLDLG